MPEGERQSDELPGYAKEMLIAAEEFRVAAAKHTGADWHKVLPRVPLTKQEVSKLLHRQMERDEITVLYQLRQLGSVAASIIIGLQLTREVLQEAFNGLQRDRPAQITLASIVSGARFRLFYQGRTISTVCGNCKVEPDSWEHLILCYGLADEIQVGLEATRFLVTLGRRAKLNPPGVSLPFVSDL